MKFSFITVFLLCIFFSNVFASLQDDLLILEGKQKILPHPLPPKKHHYHHHHKKKHHGREYLKIKAILEILRGKLKNTIRAKKIELDIITRKENDAKRRLLQAKIQFDNARNRHESAHGRYEDVQDALLVRAPPSVTPKRAAVVSDQAPAANAQTPEASSGTSPPQQASSGASSNPTVEQLGKYVPMKKKHVDDLDEILKGGGHHYGHKRHHHKKKQHHQKHELKQKKKHLKKKLKVHKKHVKKAEYEVAQKVKELKKAHRQFKKTHKRAIIKKKHAIYVIDKCVSDLKISQTLLKVIKKRKKFYKKGHFNKWLLKQKHKKHEHHHHKKEHKPHHPHHKPHECTCHDCKHGCEHFAKCKEWCERARCPSVEHKTSPAADAGAASGSAVPPSVVDASAAK